MIKRYLIERENVSYISSILETGVSIIQIADNMGKKKIFKPSEYEIAEFIGKCKKLKEALILGVTKYESKTNLIPVVLINQVKELEINKLNDCKRLGELYFEIGGLIKKEAKCNPLLMPIGSMFKINVFEGMFLGLIIFIVLIIR